MKAQGPARNIREIESYFAAREEDMTVPTHMAAIHLDRAAETLRDDGPATTSEGADESETDIDTLIAQTRTEIPAVTDRIRSGLHVLDTKARIAHENAIDIVGVFAGIKPGALFPVIADNWSPYSGKKAAALAQGIGLKCKNLDSSMLVVSRHDRIIQEITDANWDAIMLNDYAAKTRLGKLFGYPVSATQYYVHCRRTHDATGQTPPSGDEFIPDVLKPFCGFAVSPEHYQSEIDSYARPLQEAVMMLTPHLYERITAEEAKKKRRALGRRALTD